jgi:hypothetical protein
MTIIDIIYCVIAPLIFLGVVSCGFGSQQAKIVPAPTLFFVKKPLKKWLADNLIPENVQMAELGCGWGGMISLFHRQGIRKIIGYETSLIPYLFCKIRFLFYPDIQIRRTDFMQADLSAYPFIYTYLSSVHMDALYLYLQNSKHPDLVVLSNAFAFSQVKAHEVIPCAPKLGVSLFVYKNL